MEAILLVKHFLKFVLLIDRKKKDTDHLHIVDDQYLFCVKGTSMVPNRPCGVSNIRLGKSSSEY
ncbi:hypothetical protein J2Y02_003484 [Neobacillus drentensis]|nr:hypothetical protein [Neobacillus drentensis]